MVKTLSPELLRQRLQEDGAVTVIDTRPEDVYESWHIPGARNYPFEPDEEVDVAALREELDIDEADEIITICGKGISSHAFAAELGHLGFGEVTVVQDGMQGWSRLYELAAVPTVAATLEIFQVQRVAKGCLGYVLGSPTAGEAVIVDPTRHLDEYIRVAEDDDMTITHVIDTHIHADHISGGPDLAEQTGATYHLPAAAGGRVSRDFTPLERNDVLPLGDADIKAIHTPGHTAESVSLLIGAEAVLTADTVHVDGVGRTELQFGDAAAGEGARELYGSVHGSILSLPDGVSVLPGHFSVESRDAIEQVGRPILTTVSELRTDLPLLQLDEEDFVERLLENVPEKPPNYDRMIAINTGEADPEDEEEASALELGPNRCAAAAD